MEKYLDITKPRYSEKVFVSPLALRYIEAPLYLFNLRPYFSAVGTVLPKSFAGAFSYNSRFNDFDV